MTCSDDKRRAVPVDKGLLRNTFSDCGYGGFDKAPGSVCVVCVCVCVGAGVGGGRVHTYLNKCPAEQEEHQSWDGPQFITSQVLLSPACAAIMQDVEWGKRRSSMSWRPKESDRIPGGKQAFTAIVWPTTFYRESAGQLRFSSQFKSVLMISVSSVCPRFQNYRLSISKWSFISVEMNMLICRFS